MAVDRQKLVKLRADTEIAIKKVLNYRERPDGAVNWADLSCMQAAHVVTDEGDEYMEVTIEEVAPDACEFQKAIGAELLKLGWKNFQVMTEW